MMLSECIFGHLFGGVGSSFWCLFGVFLEGQFQASTPPPEVAFSRGFLQFGPKNKYPKGYPKGRPGHLKRRPKMTPKLPQKWGLKSCLKRLPKLYQIHDQNEHQKKNWPDIGTGSALTRWTFHSVCDQDRKMGRGVRGEGALGIAKWSDTGGFIF